ncbi:hypothetical protein [Gordonia iterans]
MLHTLRRAGSAGQRWDIDTPQSAQQDRRDGYTREPGNVRTRADDPFAVVKAMDKAREQEQTDARAHLQNFSFWEPPTGKSGPERQKDALDSVDPSKTIARRRDVGRTHSARKAPGGPVQIGQETWDLGGGVPRARARLFYQIFNGLCNAAEHGTELPAGIRIDGTAILIDSGVLRTLVTRAR